LARETNQEEASAGTCILECVGKDGKESAITLGTIERFAGSTTAENLGVNLQESKQIVNRLQDTVVKQQLQEYCEQRRKCLTCDRLQPVKDYRRRRLGTGVPEGSAIFELAINPGRFEDLKTLMADMVEATQKNEVGTLNYEWAISDDQRVCHVYERYRDSAAVMTHLESFGANFAVRLTEAVTPARLVVYGTPSAQVKDGLAGLDPVYMAPLGGFRR
jgi:quinol monooxygenase YgiN